MKKHLSVFGLFARSSVYKVLGALFLMGIAEAGLFWAGLRKALADYNTQGETEFGEVAQMLHLEEIFEKSFIPWCFAITFAVITILICLPGTEYQSKTGYTLKRLSISEKQVFLHQALYNTMVYMLLLAVQVLVCFGLCRLYIAKAPADLIGNQTIFLAFYRNAFLHSILPLSEAGLWLRNAFLVVALGFAAAEFPFRQRRKNLGVLIIILALYVILTFETGIGSFYNIFFTIVDAFIFVLFACKAIYTVIRKEELDEN